MVRLALVLYSMIGTTMAGSFVVAALTLGKDTAQPVMWSAAAGFLLALPVAFYVAKQIKG